MKKQPRTYYDRLLRIISCVLWAVIIAAIVLSLTGCKCPCSVIPSGGTHDHDSTRIEYVHDSISVDRWHTILQKGDTVFIHDSIYYYKWRNKHDSIYINNTDTIYQTVTIESKGSAFLRGSGIALWCLLGALVLGAIIGIIIKFAK